MKKALIIIIAVVAVLVICWQIGSADGFMGGPVDNFLQGTLVSMLMFFGSNWWAIPVAAIVMVLLAGIVRFFFGNTLK